MTSAEKAIHKLRRPPNAHNWAKNVRPRRDDTAFLLYNFALHGPRHSLRLVQNVIKQIVVDGISLEQALKCLEAISDPLVKRLGKHILGAFHPYCKRQGWQGVEVFPDWEGSFRVAANVQVPVKPTFIINDGKRLIPYFVICWAKLNLTNYQKRVLSTLITSAVLSLEDFSASDAVILATPLEPYSKFQRRVIEWRVSGYPILDHDEKQELFDRYAGALADAERMIVESLT